MIRITEEKNGNSCFLWQSRMPTQRNDQTKRPFSMAIISLPRRSGWSGMWVAWMMVTSFAFRVGMRSSKALMLFSSILEVGSSSSSTYGFSTRALAIATRCCSPPESSRASRRPKPDKPIRSRASWTRRCCSSPWMPRIFRP